MHHSAGGRTAVNLAGARAKSRTPWFNDPPVAVYALLADVLQVCEAYDVEPVGSLDVALVPSVVDDDVALRWELRSVVTAPTHGNGKAPPPEEDEGG